MLRGSKLDVFGYTEERKRERKLIDKIFFTVDKISEVLNEENHNKIIDFLDIPLSIKGYGHVKEKNMDEAEAKWDPTLDKIISNNKLKKLAS